MEKSNKRPCHTKERGQRMAHLGRQLDLHGWLGWPVAHREDIDIQLYVARDLVMRHLGREAREGRKEGKREVEKRRRELEEREEGREEERAGRIGEGERRRVRKEGEEGEDRGNWEKKLLL